MEGGRGGKGGGGGGGEGRGGRGREGGGERDGRWEMGEREEERTPERKR